MQRSYRRRIKEWEEICGQDEIANDVAEITGERKVRAAKPRRIYLDMEELAALVRLRMEEWRDGKWRHLSANRDRITKKFFHLWEGVVRQAVLGLSAPTDLRRRTRPGSRSQDQGEEFLDFLASATKGSGRSDSGSLDGTPRSPPPTLPELLRRKMPENAASMSTPPPRLGASPSPRVV
mmetsp:Transcript_68918/g.190797  ORF Transcript_68918/g.190797 Transcript_68918/m.190797 type:complete len:179 (+) Transcript_68918:2-538(+)